VKPRASGERAPGLSRLLAPLGSLHHEHVRLPRAARLVEVLAELGGGGESLLDVGAGDGLIGAGLARKLGATRAVGVDVRPQHGSALPTVAYDGARLPFEDRSFELVVLSDVLHHAADPLVLLREALRVASRAVLLKDHLAFSPLTHALLWAMDVAGNLEQGVEVRARYFDPASLRATLEACDGELEQLRWPLEIHTPALGLVLPSRLHFAASLRRRRHPMPAEAA
jgi:SAM-dependent methyltransferase